VTDLRRTIDAIWRIESAKLVAGLARMVRDVGLAEELAQDALVAALEAWLASGVPENPGVARRSRFAKERPNTSTSSRVRSSIVPSTKSTDSRTSRSL
jgi:predicted RNA polymerase sigma factor